MESRASFSLPPPSQLRDRAARVGERQGAKVRPRRRYIAEQREKIAGRMLPMMAMLAAMTGAITILDLLLPKAPPPRMATIVGLGLGVVLGVGALIVPLLKNNLDALVILGSAAWVSTELGWGLIAHATGGASSPYLMLLPLACISVTALVPMPPRVAIACAVAAYVALLLASPTSPPYAHLLVVGVGAAGIVLARSRHTASISTFRRIEKYRSAVARMRSVQEQLVVVEKLEALRVLVGGMAHELNNALAISVASNQQAAKAVLADAPDSPAAGAIKRSDGGLTRIRRTVDRIRRFAMSAEGVLEPADVGAMLDFALESAIGRARSGVIIERTYDPSVGAIECHVAALAEALFQIARNAVEAMPGGGTIHATVRNEGDRVLLSVADEGHGIPAADLARVFDPFYSRGRTGGVTMKSGLGLSAVYGLVSALGGRVDIQSAVGRGTEVAITMPRRERPAGLRRETPGNP
jgi:signal transduction histidine kinase